MMEWLHGLYRLALKMAACAARAPGQYEWAQVYFAADLEAIEILYERLLGDDDPTPWPCQKARARLEKKIVDKISTLDAQPHWPMLRRVRQ